MDAKIKRNSMPWGSSILCCQKDSLASRHTTKQQCKQTCDCLTGDEVQKLNSMGLEADHDVLVVGSAGRGICSSFSQALGPHAIMGSPHPLPCWLMPLPWRKGICSTLTDLTATMTPIYAELQATCCKHGHPRALLSRNITMRQPTWCESSHSKTCLQACCKFCLLEPSD